jgi:hypothetical protein
MLRSGGIYIGLEEGKAEKMEQSGTRDEGEGGRTVPLVTLLTNILNCYSLNAIGQISHPYFTTRTIICILMYGDLIIRPITIGTLLCRPVMPAL